MEEVLSRLQTLTPDELRVEITRAGLKCGPITATTRGIFEKKLARTLLENQGDGDRSEVAIADQGTRSSEQTQPPTAIPEVTNLEKDDLDTSTQSLEDVSQQASPESPSVFYGVLPPLDDPLLNDGARHVYTDKQKALRAVTKMKGARFKAFSSREEAENFAKGISDGGLSPNKPSAETSHITSPAEKSISLEMANVEKPNEFRSPRTQDLTAKLRRAVEKGDEEAFKELVWSNPRYLIGSGDNPTIVQIKPPAELSRQMEQNSGKDFYFLDLNLTPLGEGCRYNVLHVAAKENQPGMARLILETLESPEFMRLMYPDDQEDMLWQRIDYIVDLYLNTPDKASNETPLHFACKFGCTEVVNVLCSHPAIDKNCRNKYGQKPSSVICERKNKSKETKQKINDYLEDRFFVPLLRATDNTLNPVISMPWAPGSPECSDLSLSSGLVDDPKNPMMTIRAFAGPLNRLKAEEFHKLWKTPPRNRARYFHDILKSDPDRGAERVGRELAHEMRYPWAEYWDFLSCFTDLSADAGLNMLEEYLNKNKKGAAFTGHGKESSYISGTFLDSLSGMSHDSGTDENSNRSFHKKYPVCDLLQDFERVSLSQASENTADSGLGCLAGSRELSSVRGREWSEDDDSSSEEYYTADEGTDTLCQEDGSRGHHLPACGILARPSPWRHGEWDLNSSGSSNSSYKSTLSIPEETRMTEDLWQNVFLTGESPSKLDNEVLLAISGMNIEEQLYPCITKWKNTVLSHPESQRQRWPNVALMNRYPESKTSTPHRLTRSWLTGSPSFLNMKQFIPGPCMYNSTTSKTSTSS